MQRKGIRGTWRSSAGALPSAVPTGTKVDRDLRIGRLDVGGVPQCDQRFLTTDPILGAYTENIGNDPNAIAKFEQQLNRPIDVVVAFTDSNSADVTSNTWPFDLQWPCARKLVLSHALIGYGWDMADSAIGNHDAEYTTAANNLVQWRDRILSIRIGWEFNADNGYPWSQGGAGGSNQTPTNYALSFARFAAKIRERLPGIPIDWCPLADHDVPDPWYPGDEYVDIIGNDVYVKQAFHSNNFSQVLTWDAGLYWQEAFATSHGKMMAYPEWAIDYASGATFIERMAEWMRKPRSARVLYQAYWNSDSVVSSALDGKPINLAAFKAAFAEL